MMTPVSRVLVLLIGCVAWMPVGLYLGRLSAENQDAAGKVIYGSIGTVFLWGLGAMVFGIPAIHQTRKQAVPLPIRIVAWCILLSPALGVGWVVLSELLF